MEHFREEVVTAEDQEQQVELRGNFPKYAFQVLTRHEALTRQFYSFDRTTDEETARVPGSIEGQLVLPIEEFSK